jgi:hypothetical protein
MGEGTPSRVERFCNELSSGSILDEVRIKEENKFGALVALT